MDLGPLRALALDLNFSAHGVPITVSVEGADAIASRGVWLTTVTESLPEDAPFTRRDPVRVMALRRNEVPTIPVGSIIEAPEKSGDAIEAWVVDGFERQEADHQRVIVRRRCEA